jgi:type I restriction enzyme S subunit
MTKEEFLETFDLVAEAPGALTKVRDLVLELAVCGRLTTAAGTPSARGVNAAQIPIGRANQPFELPRDWRWVRVNELQPQFQNGVSSRGDLGGIPVVVLRLADVANRRVHLHRTRELPIAADQIARYQVQVGDILITRVNGSADIVGTFVPIESNINAIYCDHFIRMRVDVEVIDPRYLTVVGTTRHLRDQIQSLFITTAGQKTVNQGHIAGLTIPLPPLAEQKRIVGKVDELMTLCDRLEVQQNERDIRHAALARAALTRFVDAPTPANLNFLFHKSYTIPPVDLRKSILTLAVKGELVPVDASEKQTVGDHIEFQNGFAFKSEWFRSTGTRLCRNANVSHGFLDWRDSAFVDDKITNEFKRFALAEGDIVLSLDRPLITTGLKVACIRRSDLPCLLLQRVAKVVPRHDQLDPLYFLLWLNSSEFVDSIDPGRSNGVPHISTRQVERLPFVLPALAEQRRIVSKVNKLMTLVTELETQLVAARAMAAKLLNAIVGELTAWR